MGVLTMSSARALKFIWPNLGEPAFERKFLSAEVPPLKTSNTLTMAADITNTGKVLDRQLNAMINCLD